MPDQALRYQAELPSQWLVTGASGFIGSHLVEHLLSLGRNVVGLDNFETGSRRNLTEVQHNVGPEAWARFSFIEGDIRSLDDCRSACAGAEVILHQAALGSVPRSLNDPIRTNSANIDGFLNMLVAARDEGVRRFVYAASSSTYGDHPGLPKVEATIGAPLSPYAVTKLVNELYADVFWKAYRLSSVGLRYFNVFGPRQNPAGAYAAVIPRWIEAMISGEPVFINGDGKTSRDFCFVDNVVQANLRAATADGIGSEVFNVAVGDRTELNELFTLIRDILSVHGVVYPLEPTYREFREGDVRHSQAEISKAVNLLGYVPEFTAAQGLARTVPTYLVEDA
ncbi:MAG: SDR family oxidoreductase [Rhodothermales bacterium]|nr:SDR family oxidoreductase [Rhodothermales bacterium]MBO6781020.1 SDR family oxidoreductase [Rhodothermales bacterium]